MLIEFLLLLLLYQLTGDTFLQIDRISFKRKINRFTLLEQFVFGLVFGFLINTIFTIIIIYLGPFDYLLLFLFNFLFVLCIFIINKRSFRGFFYWRIYSNLKNKEASNISRKYYQKFLLFFIGIVILNFYFRSFNYQLEHIDLLTHTRYALDAIKYGWNFNDKYFLFDISSPYTTQIFTFTLIPFYALSPVNWIAISGVYFSQLQLFLFFTLVFIILYRYDSKFNIFLVFFISSAIVIFPTWYSYFLPSNFSLILFLMFLVLPFNKQIKSFFLEIILLFFILAFHIPSTLTVFSIPLLLTILIIFYKEPNKLIKKYDIIKAKLKSFITKNKKYIIVGVLFLAISIVILLIFGFPYLNRLVSIYFNLGLVGESINTLVLWREITIGLIFNICLLGSIVYLFRKQKIKKNKYQVLFLFLLNLYLTIYLLFFDILNKIIRTLYAEFRFIVYLDVSVILLAPILFSLIISNIEFINKYEIYFKRKMLQIYQYLMNFNLNLLVLYFKLSHLINRKGFKIRRYVNLSNFFKFSLFFLIISYSTFKAIPNYEKRYYRKFFEVFWYDSYDITTNVLEKITIGYESYMFNTNTPFSHLKAHMYAYLGDLRCIDLELLEYYFQDWKYTSNNTNYQIFLQFVFNETKLINKKQGNYDSLPPLLKIAKKVDYIIIDNLSAPNLCRLMLNDTTHFTKIFQCSMTNLILLVSYPFKDLQVFLFKTN